MFCFIIFDQYKQKTTNLIVGKFQVFHFLAGHFLKIYLEYTAAYTLRQWSIVASFHLPRTVVVVRHEIDEVQVAGKILNGTSESNMSSYKKSVLAYADSWGMSYETVPEESDADTAAVKR